MLLCLTPLISEDNFRVQKQISLKAPEPIKEVNMLSSIESKVEQTLQLVQLILNKESQRQAADTTEMNTTAESKTSSRSKNIPQGSTEGRAKEKSTSSVFAPSSDVSARATENEVILKEFGQIVKELFQSCNNSDDHQKLTKCEEFIATLLRNNEYFKQSPQDSKAEAKPDAAPAQTSVKQESKVEENKKNRETSAVFHEHNEERENRHIRF